MWHVGSEVFKGNPQHGEACVYIEYKGCFPSALFQDIYPLHYGAKYDTALQSLVWEFLCRLEELLPVPSFHQVRNLGIKLI